MTATQTSLAANHATTQNLQSLLSEDVEVVEKILAERTISPIQTIPDLANYIVSSGGKRLRPMIAVAAAKCVGGTTNATYLLAAAVELIHTATLLHDDVVDDSPMRRGKPAAKSVWGNASSILVGDFLFAKAFTLMVEAGHLEILGILSHASTVIAEGEVRQLSAHGNKNLPTEEYLAIIEAKTAALFEAAARTGALSASNNIEASNALAQYGKNLGLAFQIIDDVLDYGGTTSLIGKSIGDDFREGKVTLPVIIARRRGSKIDQSFWERALDPTLQTNNDLAHAVHLIRSTGAIDSAITEAKAYSNLAKVALSSVPNSVHLQALMDLADFCISRVN